jgi:hypothetical protein
MSFSKIARPTSRLYNVWGDMEQATTIGQLVDAKNAAMALCEEYPDREWRIRSEKIAETEDLFEYMVKQIG